VARRSGLSGVFVTGTGTEVGKTVVAAAIARTLTAEGRVVAVFKPAVTGLSEPGEADHELLRRASKSTQTDDQIAPYRYDLAASPHLAAELAGGRIEPPRLLRAARRAAKAGDVLVCEGVGGLMVPLAPGYLVRDLVRELGLPLVVAATPDLGTINHTLLSLEAARAAALEVACVVLTPWPRDPGAIQISNRRTLESLGGVPVAVLPPLDVARPDAWPRLDLPAAGTAAGPPAR
jgi:dethiobiotin synthetase